MDTDRPVDEVIEELRGLLAHVHVAPLIEELARLAHDWPDRELGAEGALLSAAVNALPSLLTEIERLRGIEEEAICLVSGGGGEQPIDSALTARVRGLARTAGEMEERVNRLRTALFPASTEESEADGST